MTMSEIKIVKRIKYAGDVHAALMQLGWDAKTAAAFLDSIPDADAVVVVRCKNCIYNKHRTEGKHILNWCGKFNNVMRDNDFCSFGEKPAYEMPKNMVTVVRCKDCAWCKKPFPEHFPQMLECMRYDMEVAADEFCSRSERRDDE